MCILRLFGKHAFADGDFRELGQLPRKLSDCLIHVCAERGPPLCQREAHPCRSQQLFFFSRHLPVLSKRAGTPRPWAPASAALLAEGEKLPRISHGWLAAGRPTEPVECMRLSNVTSVGLVGRPRRRTTINLSHRH